MGIGRYVPEALFIGAVAVADNAVAATAMGHDILLLFFEGLVFGAVATLLIGVYTLHRVGCDINAECSITAIPSGARNEVLLASAAAAAVLVAGAAAGLLARSPEALDYAGLAAFLYGLAFLLAILPHATLRAVTYVYGWGHVAVFGLAALAMNVILKPAVNAIVLGVTRSPAAGYPVAWSLLPGAWDLIGNSPGILMSWGDIVATVATAHLFTYMARRLL